jgi:RluA family pseudouridine synthase
MSKVMSDQFSIETIFVDEYLLAVNKPAGLPTLVDGYNKATPYLVGLVQQQYGRIWIVHRLDKDTSGVVLFARSADVHRTLNMAFEARRVSKVYHALVIGVPEWEEMTIDLPLRADGDRRHRTVIDRDEGKVAVTRCRVLEKFTHHALIEAKPETGRTHQIRAHLAAQGFPIAGDELYGGRKNDEVPIDRSALHARSIALEHPVTHQAIQIDALYPIDFEAALNNVRRTS